VRLRGLIAVLTSAAFVATPAIAVPNSPIGGDSTDETSQTKRPENDPKVEEMVVYGIRTGRLPSIPGASSEILFTDDFVAENKSLADILSETEGITVASPCAAWGAQVTDRRSRFGVRHRVRSS